MSRRVIHTRESILEAALKVANGPGGMLMVTISAVAQAIGCNRTSISYHWKSMTDLRRAVAKRLEQRV